MYKPKYIWTTDIQTPQEIEGESIEDQMVRVLENNEPIDGSKPMIYTERAEGILQGTDIREDKFEVAVAAMDIVQKQKATKREQTQALKLKKAAGTPEGDLKSPEASQ